MTPYELGLHITEYNEKAKQEQEEKMTLTWLGVYWNRVDAKHFPNLKDVLGQTEQPKEKTPEDMLSKIKMLNEAFGGSTN